MASLTHGAQVSRLEVVDTGRSRRWSEEEKLRIVAESFSGPRLVSSTARRHGISTSLLFTWRRTYRYGTFAVARRRLQFRSAAATMYSSTSY